MWTWTGKVGRNRQNVRAAECRCSCGFVAMVSLHALHHRISHSCRSCAAKRNARGEPTPPLDLTGFPPHHAPKKPPREQPPKPPKKAKPKWDYPETEQGREMKELLARARQGDTAPFLLRVQEVAKLAAGLHSVWDGDADDVAQETALTVLRRLDQIDEGSNVFGWVFFVARNVVRTHRQGDARRRRLLGLASEGKIKIAE